MVICRDTARCLKQTHFCGKDRGHSLSTWKTKFRCSVSKSFSPDPSCLMRSGKTNSKFKSWTSKRLIRNSGKRAVTIAWRCGPGNANLPAAACIAQTARRGGGYWRSRLDVQRQMPAVSPNCRATGWRQAMGTFRNYRDKHFPIGEFPGDLTRSERGTEIGTLTKSLVILKLGPRAHLLGDNRLDRLWWSDCYCNGSHSEIRARWVVL